MIKRSEILFIGKTLILTIFFANSLFANYSFKESNSGKIDMHGRKSENLIDEKNSLSNKDINNIGIIKPIAPIPPKILIKDDKKTENKSKKKESK